MCVDYQKDYEYARSRLTGSVVRRKGVGVYVDNVNLDGDCSILELGENDYTIVPLSELDVSPTPLGYVNTNKGVTYAYRKPARYYKQGLTTSNFAGRPFKVDLMSKDLASTIRGVFPKLLACLEDVICEEAPSRAFSRDFAFSGNYERGTRLFYRGKPVGWAAHNKAGEGVNFQLETENSYLQEALEEAVDV